MERGVSRKNDGACYRFHAGSIDHMNQKSAVSYLMGSRRRVYSTDDGKKPWKMKSSGYPYSHLESGESGLLVPDASRNDSVFSNTRMAVHP